jgi:putative transposase
VDVFSRYVVGWQASRSLRAELALDALEMAIWARRGEQLQGLLHHSDRGVQPGFKGSSQHLNDEELRCKSEGDVDRVRLALAGAVASVGSRGDSYDNALAESFNGLYKTELIGRRGSWCGLEDVEYATLEWVDWFNQRRLHTELGLVPPAKFEASQYHEEAPALLAVPH